MTASTLAQHSKPQEMFSPLLCFNAETISPTMIVFLASTPPQPKSATAPPPTAPESSTTVASSGTYHPRFQEQPKLLIYALRSSLHRSRLFTKTYMLYAHVSSLLSNEFTC